MKQLLAEKYRPNSIEGYIFQNEETKRKVQKWVKEKEIPNVMMIGQQGIGKTTLARILINELGVNSSDVKIIKGSLTNGIGVVREELEPWLKKAPMGKFKVVHLEEADALTRGFQEALRQITEEYSDFVRFIFTANYANKIIAPLFSRFQVLELSGVEEDSVIKLVLDVVEKEELFLDKDDESIILAHIDAHIPDIRKILNSIDESTTIDANGLKTLHHPISTTQTAVEQDAWLVAWERKTVDPVELLDLSSAVDNNNYEFYYTAMYNNSSKLPDEPKGVVTISKYLDRAQSTANQNLTLDACIYELFFLE